MKGSCWLLMFVTSSLLAVGGWCVSCVSVPPDSGWELLAPSIFYPKTSVHGIVVDQNNDPVTNVQVEASYHPPRLIIWATPTVVKRLQTDVNGKWSFSARKVGCLYFEAFPPAGYKPAILPNNHLGSRSEKFNDGGCPTNDDLAA